MKKLIVLMLLLMVSLLTLTITTYAITPRYVGWYSYNLFSTNYAMRLQYTFEANVDRFSIEIPITDYNEFEIGGVDSTITTYTDVDQTGTATEYLLSDLSLTVHNTYIIEQAGVRSVLILVAQNYEATPQEYNNYYQSNSVLTYDLLRVTFYNGITPIESSYFYGIPTAPVDPTPAEGYEFLGWRTLDLTPYDFTFVDVDMADEYGNFKLFAYYKSNYDLGYENVEPIPTTPSAITDVLTGIGFYNTAGFIIMYVALIGISTVLLLYIHAPVFVMIIVYILETSLFMFMGMLPLFATIIIILLLAVGLMFTWKSGGIKNE